LSELSSVPRDEAIGLLEQLGVTTAFHLPPEGAGSCFSML
jgi:hypothetical protein